MSSFEWLLMVAFMGMYGALALWLLGGVLVFWLLIWKYAKEHGIANVLFTERNSLRRQVVRVLDALNRDPKALMMIVLGHRYHLDRVPKNLLAST